MRRLVAPERDLSDEARDSERFNRKTWRRFYGIARLYFVSEKKLQGWGLLLLLATFSIAVSGLNVLMSYVGRDFMTALSLKEKDEFFYQLYLYLGAFLLATPIVVFYRYVEERLGLYWRHWLSLKLLSSYFSNRAYYKINTEGLIDNPDQRIEEDIRTFTTLSLSFLLIIFNSIIALFAFMGILWSISFWLTIAAVGYAIFGSLLTYLLGRPLIPLNFSQLKKEADYRYKLINVRDHAESIAFYRGERKEMTRARQRLKAALDNLKLIIDWNRNLGFFRTGYNYLITVLPTVIVAPLYLDGKIEFGVVTQASFAFGQVLGALSIIVSNFGGLSAFAAVVTRLGKFWELVLEAESNTKMLNQENTIVLKEGEGITFAHVTILTPIHNKPIVKDLSLSLSPQSGLLITGPSGSGKSSILRALAGLWSNGTGEIIRPPVSQLMFVPQRPYMILGTLRSQLLYGLRSHILTDDELMDVVKCVRLEETLNRVGGFDTRLDWSNILSTGEQQRISLARVLLLNPRYVFLDEATTALDRKGESLLYNLIQTRGMGYASVGHRDSLGKYHHVILELTGEGTWELEQSG
jgi:vitamin B12/bleomycin/antimicrobial peptide transport system ATP-binding/permease protein